MPLSGGRVAWLLALCLGFAGPASSEVLILEDGRAVRYTGELRRSGGTVVFRLEDGTWVSLRDGTIDWPASARAGALLRNGVPVSSARGPNEELGPDGQPTALEQLSEERVLGSLIHTGRLVARLPGVAVGATRVAPTVHLEEQVLPLVLMEPDLVIDPGLDGIVEKPLVVAITPPLLAEPPTVRAGSTTWAASANEGGVVPLIAPALTTTPETSAAVDLARLFHDREPPLLQDRPILASPRDGEVVYGATRLEARPASGGAPVSAIEYSVDGVALGRSDRAPFALTWRAPPDRGYHEIVATIAHQDGRRESARARVLSVVPDATVDVDLVSVQVTVTNQKYLFVRELSAEDFVLFEDGVRMDVAHFSRDSVPLSILVLVDASFSMSGQKLDMAKVALNRMVDHLGPLDRVGVAAFAESVRTLVPLTRDRASVRTALDTLVADGGTSMFDAQLQALSDLRWEGGRRVLIVLGDGEDYGSASKLEDVIREADRLDVSIYAIATLLYRLKDGMPEQWAEKLMGDGRPRYWTDHARARGIKFLREEVEATGGILYLPKFAGELPYVFEHVLTELKSAYSLGYYPKRQERDGGFRIIDVAVRGSGLEARTRRGYFATAEPAKSASASGVVIRASPSILR